MDQKNAGHIFEKFAFFVNFKFAVSNLSFGILCLHGHTNPKSQMTLVQNLSLNLVQNLTFKWQKEVQNLTSQHMIYILLECEGARKRSKTWLRGSPRRAAMEPEANLGGRNATKIGVSRGLENCRKKCRFAFLAGRSVEKNGENYVVTLFAFSKIPKKHYKNGGKQ